MLFIPLISDLDGQCGDWTRDQLLEMDAAFVAAVEAAFRSGLESRAAAAATARLKPALNGNQRLAMDAALGAAWDWFVGVKFEATAGEVLARVRAVCPRVSAEQVRVEFKTRLCGSNGVALGSSDGPGR